MALTVIACSQHLQVVPILSKVDALALKVAGPYRDAAAELLAKAVEADLRAAHAADCKIVSQEIKSRLPNVATLMTDQGKYRTSQSYRVSLLLT